jgi:hypothetical protein
MEEKMTVDIYSSVPFNMEIEIDFSTIYLIPDIWRVFSTQDDPKSGLFGIRGRWIFIHVDISKKIM